MYELVPAQRPEYLAGYETQPAVGIFDLGDHVQHPPREKERDGPNITFRDYRVVAFPELDPDTNEALIRAPYLQAHEAIGARMGAHDYSDFSHKLPGYMHGSGHLADFIPAEQDVVDVDVAIVDDPDQAEAQSGQCMDAILREQPLEPFVLLGEDAIVSFLRGYIQASEAGQKKWMPWRHGDYLLPRVDSDLLAMIMSGYIAGAETTALPIPEAHYYRALLNTAYVLAQFYIESRNGFETPRKPLSEFRDARQQKAAIEFSNPIAHTSFLHRDRYEFYQQPYNPYLPYLLGSYGIRAAELIEATQQVWYARTYWFEASMDVRDVYAHFDRPPNPKNAQRFIEQTSRADMHYYNELIQSCVRFAIDPYHRLQDRRE